MLHGVHNSISPGANASTLMSLLGRGGLGSALAGGASTVGQGGDILNDPAMLAHINKAFTPAAPSSATGAAWSQGGSPMAQLPPQAGPGPAPAPPVPAPPALSAQAMAPQVPPAAPQGVPMPAPRPPEAPQAPPDMGFFARNAAMMRDPSSGTFIDPANAERAQASGPDVINKLLQMFHNKDA